jgi:hypothetical protein
LATSEVLSEDGNCTVGHPDPFDGTLHAAVGSLCSHATESLALMTDVASFFELPGNLFTADLLTTTILAYSPSRMVWRGEGNPPWANPVLLFVLLIAPVCSGLTQTDHTAYFEGAQFIHLLLGPKTVALALLALG